MTKSPTPHDLEVLLEQNRAELAATIDQLTYRLDPRVKATELVAAAKQLVHDAGSDPETTAGGCSISSSRRLVTASPSALAWYCAAKPRSGR